jgi:hypothetical protein
MIEYFNFNILITPYIIGIIYLIGSVMVPFLIINLFSKYKLTISNHKYRLYVFIAFIFIEIMWRIFCEFFMVYFKIYLILQSQ